MINIKKFSWIAALGLVMATSSCTDLDEKVYDRIDASTFYKNEASVKGAIATIYNQAGNCFAERFYFLLNVMHHLYVWLGVCSVRNLDRFHCCAEHCHYIIVLIIG